MVTLSYPSTGKDVAAVLYEVAQGYAILGDKRRAAAFENAADALKGHYGTKDVSVMTQSELQKIPLVGAASAEAIQQITRTGTCVRLQMIRDKGVPSLSDLIRVEGIGPATAKSLWKEYGITTLPGLLAALEDGTLDSPNLLNRVKRALTNAERIPREAMEAALFPLVDRLRALPFVQQIMVCGSIRRKRETVKDADVVVALKSTPEDIQALTEACEAIFGAVKSGGDKKIQASVKVGDGERNVDVLITEPASFGAAVNHFTGSKEHNVQLRTMAKERGLTINEYGIFRGDERLGGEREEDLFEILGIPWVEPENRLGI